MNLPILLAETAEASTGINWHSFFFLLFALIACGMALAVLFTSNIVRMAFYLTVSLGAVAGLFILAGAHFVGAMQLMIYVGGTLVLLIFGVMLTAQAQFVDMKTRGGEWIMAAIVGGSMLAVLLAAAFRVDAWQRPTNEHLAAIEDIDVSPDTTSLGAALMGLRFDKLSQENAQLRRGMSGYFIHFEVVSVHLLVVLIGAAYLARARHSAGDVIPHTSAAPRPHRRRGLFISVILFLAVVFHALNGAFCFYLAAVGLPAGMPDLPAVESWFWVAAGVVHFAMAFTYISMLRWQKWGFFALCVLAVVQAGLALAAGAGPLAAVGVLVSSAIWLAILFGLLRLGGDHSVWAQMD
jgi:NADH-quinone oxidoreductase subunit J